MRSEDFFDSRYENPCRLFGDADDVSVPDGIWVIIVSLSDIYTFSQEK